MKSEMEKQQDSIKNLIELIRANPELRILPMVDTECVPCDDFSSWVNEWGKAEIDEVWTYEGSERLYCKSNDYDDLLEEAMDAIERERNCTDELDLEIQAKARVDNYDWEKVILVQIVPA